MAMKANMMVIKPKLLKVRTGASHAFRKITFISTKDNLRRFFKTGRLVEDIQKDIGHLKVKRIFACTLKDRRFRDDVNYKMTILRLLKGYGDKTLNFLITNNMELFREVVGLINKD